MLNLVRLDVEIEPVLQEIADKSLARWANAAPNARLDIHARGFGVDRVPHSLTYGYATQMRNLTRTSPLSKCIASMKTRRNACTQAELWRWNMPRSRRWCSPSQVAWHLNGQVYRKRLAELLSAKKGEDYSTTMSEIRTRISFAILGTSLLCLRVSRSVRRVNLNPKEMDLDIERGLLGPRF